MKHGRQKRRGQQIVIVAACVASAASPVLASLTINLRFGNGTIADTISSAFTGNIPIQVWATVTGNSPLGPSNYDGLDYVYFSLLSSTPNGRGTAVPGGLASSSLVSPFNAPGSQMGTLGDLNGDGIIDLGSTATTVSTNFVKPRSPPSGTWSGNPSSPTSTMDYVPNGVEFLVGTVNYNVTSATNGQATAINVAVPSWAPSSGPYYAANWWQDNATMNHSVGTLSSIYYAGTSVMVNVTGPVSASWSNASGGSWSTAGNWSTSAVPTATDDATFSLNNSYGVTFTTASVANNINISAGAVAFNLGSQTLQASGNLNVAANASLSVAGTLATGIAAAGQMGVSGIINFSGGTITTGALTLSNPSRLNWSTGTLNLTNSGLTIGTGGTFVTLPLVAGQTLNTSGGVVVTNGGALNMSGGTLLGSITQNGGAMNGILSSSGLFTYNSGTFSGQLVNYGAVTFAANFNAGNGLINNSTTPLNISSSTVVNLNGAGLINTGTMNLTGTLNATSEAIGSNGIFNQSNGTNAVTALTTLGGTYYLSGGTFTTGSLSIPSGGALNWSGGTLNLTNSSLTVGNGAALGSSLILSSGKNLNVTGTGQSLSITGSLNLSGGGLSVQTIIQTGGTFTDTGTLLLAQGGGNAAAYNLSGGTFNGGTLGSGTLIVAGGGSLAVSGGQIQNNGGAVGGYNGSGSVSLTGMGSGWNSSGSVFVGNNPVGVNQGTGTITVNPAATLLTTGTLKIWNSSGNAVNLVGGTIQVASLDTSGVPANFNWTSGSLLITNSGLAVASTGPLGSSVSVGAGMTLGVNGNIQISSGASLTQSATGILTAGSVTQTGGSFGASSLVIGPGAIGSYALSGGNAVVGANLQVSGGSLIQSGIGTFAAGSILLTSGNITQSAPGSIITASLNQTGGTLTVPSLTPGSGGIGAYNWSGGTLAITNTNVEVGPTGLFGPTLSLASNKTLVAGVGVTIDPGSVLNLQGGGLTINAGASLSNLGTFNQIAGILTVNGALVNSGTAFFGGNQSWGANSVFVNLGGTATINANLNPSGFGPAVVITGGTANFTASQQFPRLAIGGLAVVTPPANRASVTVISTASLSVTGTLDLTGNDLDVQGGSLPAVVAMVAQGYNAGSWHGTGITSSTAASDPAHLSALGVIQNNQSGIALFTASHSFDATTPGIADLLVKYTYYGDTNLDGKVDGSDYSRIDAGYLSHGNLTGWYNGDFNFDGTIDGSDYTLIDNAFNAQGAQLTSAIADETSQIASTAPVPEPALVGAVGLCSLVLLRRRSQYDSRISGASAEKSTQP